MTEEFAVGGEEEGARFLQGGGVEDVFCFGRIAAAGGGCGGCF